MTTPSDETKPEYIHRSADDGGGGLASPSEIADNITADFEDLGTIYTDQGDIPTTASVRPAGVFTDAYSAREWLEYGGLVATDNSGNVEPMGFVYFLKYFDDVLYQDVWEVWIDENTS